MGYQVSQSVVGNVDVYVSFGVLVVSHISFVLCYLETLEGKRKEGNTWTRACNVRLCSSAFSCTIPLMSEEKLTSPLTLCFFSYSFAGCCHDSISLGLPFPDSNRPPTASLLLSLLSGISLQRDCGFLEMQGLVQISLKRDKIKIVGRASHITQKLLLPFCKK